MYKIKVLGKASQSLLIDSLIDNKTAKLIALDWLRSQYLPIASSCEGVGVCQKCVVNGSILSCQKKLLEFYDQTEESIMITIAYL